MGLKNEQFNLIMNEYDSRRFNRTAEINRRTQLIYNKIPAYREADDNIRRFAVSEVARRIEGNSSTSSTSSFIRDLTNQKKKLLVDNGFSEDFLDVPYICPDCKDTGFIGNKRCHCFNQLANDLIYNNLTAYSKDYTLEDFSLEYYSSTYIDKKSGKSSLDLAQKALDISREFVDSFNERYDNILLYGKPGTGKTHLSGCIGNELRTRGISVVYLSAFELFSIMKKEAFSKSIYPDNEYLRLFSTDFLIIDDLGSEFSNTMTFSQLFQLLNERILEEKSTLISTNLDLAGLSNLYTERIVSRLMQYYKLLPLIGEDIRIIRKTKGESHA